MAEKVLTWLEAICGLAAAAAAATCVRQRPLTGPEAAALVILRQRPKAKPRAEADPDIVVVEVVVEVGRRKSHAATNFVYLQFQAEMNKHCSV